MPIFGVAGNVNGNNNIGSLNGDANGNLSMQAFANAYITGNPNLATNESIAKANILTQYYGNNYISYADFQNSEKFATFFSGGC